MSIREAPFLPGSGASHRLVPVICMFPQSPEMCGSRQPGSGLRLLLAAAPLSPPTGIQLWSFCCCQPCWLQQSMPYPLAKALLCPCFPLCHCLLKNPPNIIWVLMARNQHLIVIWKDSLLQTRHLFPLLGSAPQPVHFTRSCGYGESQSSGGNTLGEKLTWMNLYPCSPVCRSTAVLPLEASVHLAFGSMKNPDESHLAALPLVHREMEAEHSLSGGRPLRSTRALRALRMWGNNLMIWFNMVDYSVFTNTLLFIFRGCLVFLLIFVFAQRQHHSLVGTCSFLCAMYKLKLFEVEGVHSHRESTQGDLGKWSLADVTKRIGKCH